MRCVNTFFCLFQSLSTVTEMDSWVGKTHFSFCKEHTGSSVILNHISFWLISPKWRILTFYSIPLLSSCIPQGFTSEVTTIPCTSLQESEIIFCKVRQCLCNYVIGFNFCFCFLKFLKCLYLGSSFSNGMHIPNLAWE